MNKVIAGLSHDTKMTTDKLQEVVRCKLKEYATISYVEEHVEESLIPKANISLVEQLGKLPVESHNHTNSVLQSLQESEDEAEVLKKLVGHSLHAASICLEAKVAAFADGSAHGA